MDEQRFDEMARRWGRLSTSGGTRRSAVRSLLGLAGFGADLASFGDDAEAAGSGTCRRADPGTYITKQTCEPLSCGNTPGCLCIQTLGHKPECLIGFDPDAPNNRDCPKEDECNKRRKCRNGFKCAKVVSCCGKNHRRCLRRCPA